MLPPDRPEKITFAETREQGVRVIMIYCRTTGAATPSRSAGVASPMMLGCPTSRIASSAEHAASGGRRAPRLQLGQDDGRGDARSLRGRQLRRPLS